ncbi:MAG: biotin/lipoyl-containing protein, partial [Pseudonocardiaceae bacterium]
MTRIQHFLLPDAGEGLTEAEILTWHVAPGDTVTVNQIIVEIETAKAAVELPSPYAGVVSELCAQPGATVQVGSPLIAIDVGPGAAAPETPPGGKIGEEGSGGRIANLVGYGPQAGAVTRRRRKEAGVAPAGAAPAAAATARGPVPLAKPPVRKLARELGIDLQAVLGSGTGGVITREDVQHAAARAGNGSAAGSAT